jgi:hypothetical protein
MITSEMGRVGQFASRTIAVVNGRLLDNFRGREKLCVGARNLNAEE